MPPKPTEAPTEEKKSSPTPKRRNKRRILLISSIILFALLSLANGPIARWAIHRALDNAFTSIGMKGDLRVEGTVLSGLGLYDLHFTGDQGIEKVSLNSLTLNYEIREIISGKIRGVDLEKFHLVIDSAKFPESEEAEQDTTTKVRETLAEIRPYLTSPKIDLKDLHVTLLKNDQLTADFTLKELSHAPGSGIYQITGFKATDATAQSTPLQDVTLNWQPEAASVTRLELLPQIAVEKVQLDWKSNLQGEAQILMDDAQIDTKLTDSISINLTRGMIRSSFLNRKFALNLPVSFVIGSADFEITDWDQPIPHWHAQGTLGVAEFDQGDVSVRDANITLSQKDTAYNLSLTASVDGVSIDSTAKGKWKHPDEPEWWSSTTLDYTLKANASRTPKLLANLLPQNNNLSVSQTRLNLEGSVTMEAAELTRVTTEGSVAGISIGKTPIPEANIKANYGNNAPITASLNIGERIQLSGSYDLDKEHYRGKINVNEPDPTWINNLITSFNQNIQLKGPTQLTWQGSGSLNLNKPQTGKLNITQLGINSPDIDPINLTGSADYAWPKSLTVTQLTAKQADWLATANASWDGKTISLTGVELFEEGQSIANIQGTAPYNADISNLNAFFKQTQPWDLRFNSKPLAFAELKKWFGRKLLDGLTGKVAADLEITGSPSSPSVQGLARLSDVNGLDPSQKAPISASVNLRSEGDKLRVNTEVKEGDSQLVNGKFTLPFEPNKLLDNPEIAEKWLSSAKLEGTASINTLPMERLKRFVPQLEKIQGSISGNATLSGTLSQPRYAVDITAKAPLIRLRESGIGDVQDVVLNATIDDQQKINTRLTANINGGKFEVTGTGDITDAENPMFNLNLIADHALVHRDDLISVRANTNLNIAGIMKDATISGNIGIVESLIYKDMELIPIGVPSSEVAKVKLPALNSEKADSLPVPAPFSNWKLDVKLTTTDPILVRGNVASGYIQGSVKLGGTLANPRPDGTLIAKDIKAKLPFSILNVPRGEITFKPDSGLIPTLSIRGKSTVGSYDVSVFVYGSASSPKTTLTSYPPLPETEIMSLLGTGTTTSGLEDRDVASFKAFQVFLMKLKKRNDKPGGNKLFKHLLESVDNLNLNVGEKDRFTGRKYSSATIEVTPKWHLTAQVDAEQQTRGLIVYVIRFR